MIPHETALITILLERLKKTITPEKDSEAETLIRQTTAEQPDAAYHLVQTVLIQDLSLHVAHSRIAELERSLAQAKTTSFLPPGLLLDETKPVDRSGPGTPAGTLWRCAASHLRRHRLARRRSRQHLRRTYRAAMVQHRRNARAREHRGCRLSLPCRARHSRRRPRLTAGMQQTQGRHPAASLILIY